METETDPTFKFSRDKGDKGGQFNFNSLIGAIALAAIWWVGNKTQTTSESVTEIKTTIPFMTQTVAELKTQVGQLVTRAEMESRFSELAAKNAVLDARLMKLEYERRKSTGEQP